MAADLRVEEYTVGGLDTNCYFMVNVDTKQMLIVDPGADGMSLAERIRHFGYKPVAILLTHGHFDHAFDAGYLKKIYGIPIYAHETEKATLEDPEYNLSGGFMRQGLKFSADVYLKDDEVIELAGFTIRAIHTPGHTEGGVCYYFEGNKTVVCGDTLFNGSVGRTDFPGGDMQALISSIKEKLFQLPGDTEVLTGHGPRTTLSYERQYNDFL